MLCQLAPTVVTSYPSIGASCHKKLQIKNPSNTKSNDNTDIIIKLNENIIGSLKNSIIMLLIGLTSLMQNTQMTFL